jgi:hypothetical protein
VRLFKAKTGADAALALPTICADVGVSPSEYAALYAPMIERTAASVVAIEPVIQRVLTALRARQGAMLPGGAKPEDMALMAGAMTYALVAAMLLEASCHNEPPGLPLIHWQGVIPEHGLHWIAQYPPVLSAFIGYFTDPERSALRQLNNPIKRNKGEQFLDWLRAHPEQAMVTEDKALFVPYPMAFSTYAPTLGLAEKTVLNQVLRLNYHRMTAEKKPLQWFTAR